MLNDYLYYIQVYCNCFLFLAKRENIAKLVERTAAIISHVRDLAGADNLELISEEEEDEQEIFSESGDLIFCVYIYKIVFVLHLYHH